MGTPAGDEGRDVRRGREWTFLTTPWTADHAEMLSMLRSCTDHDSERYRRQGDRR
ncbi:hypothetical protein [Aeromicrobium sp. REDSEA-S38_B2]|jgi:hypothetical protein|uniref:hypothetical protein n=1 Tax=Aeromicrobium sp. REDSEA-S38_B2 TaxID=1811528 RepID=UPI000AFA3312|nr:hypothetical protein [Aeromicrobium sp. REDSEA-S38_B2]